jgi:hypothetical protein
VLLNVFGNKLGQNLFLFNFSSGHHPSSGTHKTEKDGLSVHSKSWTKRNSDIVYKMGGVSTRKVGQKEILTGFISETFNNRIFRIVLSNVFGNKPGHNLFLSNFEKLLDLWI